VVVVNWPPGAIPFASIPSYITAERGRGQLISPLKAVFNEKTNVSVLHELDRLRLYGQQGPNYSGKGGGKNVKIRDIAMAG
jgi:hypothetical protein